MLKRKWRMPDDLPSAVDRALQDFMPLERKLLYRRGCTTVADAERYLSEGPQALGNPFQFSGMRKAVDCLQDALQQGEAIVVYGDFDADGLTATALLTGALREEGGIVRHYIPDRFDEGYGLNAPAIRKLHASGTSVLVTVDCGIRAHEEIALANNLGMRVILTDHHRPGETLPPALAVINPHQPGDSYPFKGLSGVGLAFKLAQAVREARGKSADEAWLDLVAVGTVADLVPLEEENRSLVRQGLQRLRSRPRPGLRALMDVASVLPKHVDARTIGFVLAPRLNAAGRMDSPAVAYALLQAEAIEQARNLADKLDALNAKRRKIMLDTIEQARQRVQRGLPALIFVAQEGFHEGVVGLAASRLAEEYYRPVFVGAFGEQTTRASGRSVPGFNLAEALDQCADLLERYGGHSAAAGLTVANDNLAALEERLIDLATEALGEGERVPELQIDALTSFSELGWDLLNFLDRMEPCGEGNPQPLFAAQGVEVLSKRIVGRDQGHLKLTLRQNEISFDAIAFRQAEQFDRLHSQVDLAFRLERNDYWDVPSLQLNVVDLQPGPALP